ncbi:zinc finger protein 211-like [Phocoena sinus]|uniref:zinc finger protein 211-like n=1 Tax=Phocoena sinus TaxID=42100 RepID=UPI0013C4AEEC|nr:zinc finger protein 211-like [Phocoena sinus]
MAVAALRDPPETLKPRVRDACSRTRSPGRDVQDGEAAVGGAWGGVTFEDIALYFSWEEWKLLDEAQRRLYHDVMLENFALISSLGCCCGAEDAEAPFQRSISISMSQARTHREGSFSQKSHPCKKCSLILRGVFHLAEHEETQHSQKVFGCRICMKRYHFSANLQKHQKQDMEEKSFRNAVVRALFVKSFKCHVSRKPFTCEEVGKDFLATLGHLQQQITHTREKPNKIAQREATLQSRESHYSWGEFKKAFSPKHALVQNQGVHPGRHCFVCSECGKTFRRTSTLNLHRRIHTAARQYKCSKCGKSFNQNFVLIYPWRRHIGENCYLCSECAQFPSCRSILIRQRTIHTGERRYECTQCGISFRRKFYLIVHWRVHTGERPYDCTRYSFSTGEFTQEKGLMSAVSVGNPLVINLTSLNTGRFIVKKAL